MNQTSISSIQASAFFIASVFTGGSSHWVLLALAAIHWYYAYQSAKINVKIAELELERAELLLEESKEDADL